jgi:hypothetical protein
MCATGFHVFSQWFIFIYFEAQPFRCVYEIKEDVKLTETLLSILTSFMNRRPIVCTLYCAVDFLNVLKKYIMYL